MKITLRCMMNLQKFPFDSQSCPLIMESWSYSATQPELRWESNSPIADIFSESYNASQLELQWESNSPVAVITCSGSLIATQPDLQSELNSPVTVIFSGSYNASQLELQWEPNSPVTVDQQLIIPEYSFAGITLSSSIATYVDQTSSMHEHYGKSAKNFSTLTVHFAVQRQYGFYIMDYYVPSILLVAVSWVTFWLHANSTPARTILGTSTMLTFITLSRNIGNSLPKVSYIKATEIWFIGCTGFIFSSLAEFAFVNVVWRREKSVNLKKKTGKHILISTLTPQTYHRELKLTYSKSSPALLSMNKHQLELPVSGRSLSISSNPNLLTDFYKNRTSINLPSTSTGEEQDNRSLLTMTPQEVANWIDRQSRLVFPVAFVVFNCFYWTWTVFVS